MGHRSSTSGLDSRAEAQQVKGLHGARHSVDKVLLTNKDVAHTSRVYANACLCLWVGCVPCGNVHPPTWTLPGSGPSSTMAQGLVVRALCS